MQVKLIAFRLMLLSMLEKIIPVLKALATTYREEAAQPQGTFYSPIVRCLAGARILCLPSIIVQCNSMKLIQKLRHPTRRHDPLYFLVHNYYVSRRFTLRQRVDVAMNHHKYELRAFNCGYARQVYRSDGILLWQRSIGDLRFTILLTASDDNRHEGDLTAILSADGINLCRMSFCYLNASVFRLHPNMAMLISRNQTYRNSARDAFDQYFKQNAPQFFCLFAICGIAMANGFKTVFGIKHYAQIAYEKPREMGFRNSYTALWEKFDAVEINQHVFMLNVPLKLRPVGLVSRVHRRRARARRGYWDEIAHSARESMVKYRTFPSSDSTFVAASFGAPDKNRLSAVFPTVLPVAAGAKPENSQRI